jgi:hypothetical protein
MQTEELVRRCDDHLAAHAIAAEMTFVDGFLTLGAGRAWLKSARRSTSRVSPHC